MDEGIQAGRVACRTRVYFWVERERCILWMLIKCWTEDSLVMARKTTADGEVETGWLGAWSSVLWPVSQDVCVSSVHYPVSSPKACWTMQWAQRWNLLFFTPLTPNCASHLHDGRWSVEILHATERKTNKQTKNLFLWIRHRHKTTSSCRQDRGKHKITHFLYFKLMICGSWVPTLMINEAVRRWRWRSVLKNEHSQSPQ